MSPIMPPANDDHVKSTRFIIDEFRSHEIVLLGEPHRVKENLLFTTGLIPALHQAGINTIFIEFSNYATRYEFKSS
jgi:hypothetical protein